MNTRQAKKIRTGIAAARLVYRYRGLHIEVRSLPALTQDAYWRERMRLVGLLLPPRAGLDWFDAANCPQCNNPEAHR